MSMLALIGAGGFWRRANAAGRTKGLCRRHPAHDRADWLETGLRPAHRHPTDVGMVSSQESGIRNQQLRLT